MAAVAKRKMGETGGAGPMKKKAKKKGPPASMAESQQYLSGNFRGALQEHLDRGGKTTNLAFTTVEQDSTIPKVFVSKCNLKAIKEGTPLASNEEGTGHAGSKKKAMQFAALDVILKMGLITPEQHGKLHPAGGKESNATPKKTAQKKKGAPAKMIESHQYKNGNFRSALQEHLDRGGKSANLSFTTTEQPSEGGAKNTKLFISKCKLQAIKDQPVPTTDEGIGHAGSKKKAMQYAALDLILKMGLVTAEEHVKLHPTPESTA